MFQILILVPYQLHSSKNKPSPQIKAEISLLNFPEFLDKPKLNFLSLPPFKNLPSIFHPATQL